MLDLIGTNLGFILIFILKFIVDYCSTNFKVVLISFEFEILRI